MTKKYDITRWGIPFGEIVFKQKMRRRRWWERLKKLILLDRKFTFSSFFSSPWRSFQNLEQTTEMQTIKNSLEYLQHFASKKCVVLEIVEHITKEPWFITFIHFFRDFRHHRKTNNDICASSSWSCGYTNKGRRLKKLVKVRKIS